MIIIRMTHLLKGLCAVLLLISVPACGRTDSRSPDSASLSHEKGLNRTIPILREAAGDVWIDLTHPFDASTIYWPTEDGFKLPLAAGVLGTTIDTGEDRADPADDIVVTPTAATCSGCHDDAVSKAHMETTGGASFSTTQQAIDDGEVVESCPVCHGAGHAFDVGLVHEPSEE